MSTPLPFEINSEFDADTGRLGILGELDMATVPQLEHDVRTILARGVSRLIIDLSQLSFIDSSGLRLFILLSEQARTDGWKLDLTRPCEQVLSIFQITKADENLPFIEEAAST